MLNMEVTLKFFLSCLPGQRLDFVHPGTSHAVAGSDGHNAWTRSPLNLGIRRDFARVRHEQRTAPLNRRPWCQSVVMPAWLVFPDRNEDLLRHWPAKSAEHRKAKSPSALSRLFCSWLMTVRKYQRIGMYCWTMEAPIVGTRVGRKKRKSSC